MKLGGLDISTVKLGASQVQAIYQGQNLVWQNAPVATAATGVGQTSFTANWEAYTGAVVYLLDVSTSPTFDTFIYENQEVNAPSTSYVVIGLESNTTYYYRVRASDTDLDAQAFFDRVTTAGGTLSTTEQDAVNQLVLDMKADGIWTKMKAIYPMVGASAAACAQNLKSSSFTGTFTATGWTFASTGVTPNGTNAFFNTNLISSSLFDVTSGQHLCSYNATPSLRMTMGSGSGATINQSYMWKANTHTLLGVGTNTTINNVAGFALGVYLGGRSVTYNNANKTTDIAKPFAGFSNYNMYISSYNAGGSASLFDNSQNRFASIGDGLTADEAGYLYNAVQAFQTTLNRAII